MQLTVSQLAQMIPMNIGDATTWLGPVNLALQRWQIDSEPRVAGFLAQMSHESNRFRSLRENLNYSVQGLANTWSHFCEEGKAGGTPNDLACQYGRCDEHPCDQEALANFIYANRNGNGDVASGDGWAFRGGGLPQLTGRANYQAYQDASGVPVVKNPDFASYPQYAADIGGWFWRMRGCNEMMDVGNFAGTTKAINGPAMLGAEDRSNLFLCNKRVLGI